MNKVYRQSARLVRKGRLELESQVFCISEGLQCNRADMANEMADTEAAGRAHPLPDCLAAVEGVLPNLSRRLGSAPCSSRIRAVLNRPHPAILLHGQSLSIPPLFDERGPGSPYCKQGKADFDRQRDSLRQHSLQR